MALSLPFSPSGIVAPMVGCSDLPFRLLCLRHGATVAYTEMLFSEQLVSDPKYVEEMLRTCPEEAGKVVVQICGNDPQVMAMATAICKEKMCGLAAIDINLGCPQAIAKAGRFGSYLHDRRYWPLLTAIIGAMRAECPTLPITCQIRIQDGPASETVEYAQMLERAGACMIAVHGRPRGSPKHRRAGSADLTRIAAVSAATSVPVVSNGNVFAPRDVLDSMEVTSCDGVMSAEGLLHDPGLFERAWVLRDRASTAPGPSGGAGGEGTESEGDGRRGRVFALFKEYVDLCRQHVEDKEGVAQGKTHLKLMLGKRGRPPAFMYTGCELSAARVWFVLGVIGGETKRRFASEIRRGFTRHTDIDQGIDRAATYEDLLAIADKALGQAPVASIAPPSKPWEVW